MDKPSFLIGDWKYNNHYLGILKMKTFLSLLRCSLIFLSLFTSYHNIYGQSNFWEKVDGPWGGVVTAIAFDSSNHIYSGVYGYNLTYNSEVGVYRSDNNGESWKLTNNDLGFYMLVQAIAINSSGYIFASFVHNGEGMFCSTDNGETWTEKNYGLTNPFVRSIVFNSNGDIFAGTYNGVFISTNNGNNWTEIDSGLTGKNVFAIAIGPTAQIFAGTFDRGMFQSTNNGSSWIEINNGITNSNITACAVDSQNNIFAGAYDGNIFRSTNNGENWIKLNSGTSSMIHAIKSGLNNYIYAATESQGIYRSTNNGDDWTVADSGLPYTWILSLNVDSDGRIFAGTNGGGFFCSTNNGNSWFHSSKGLNLVSTEDLGVDYNGNIFISGGDVICRSTDDGFNWRVMDGGFSFMIGIFKMNRSGSLFYCTDGKIFRSLNYGENWTIIDSMNSRTILTAGEKMDVLSQVAYVPLIFEINLSTDNGDTWAPILSFEGMEPADALIKNNGDIYIAHGSGVYRSTDSGGNWKYSELPGLVAALILDSHDNLIAGTNPTAVSEGGIYKSTDEGDTWKFINGSPPVSVLRSNIKYQIVALGIEETNPNIFVSGNDGESWQRINNGLPNRSYFRGMAIDSIGRVLIGTDSGLFRSFDPVLGIKETKKYFPSGLILEQNYPNPFNPNTTISYFIPKESYVKVLLFNSLGELVKVLADEIHSAGEHKINFSAEDLVSGVYFYQLLAGGNILTKKLIILK